MNEINEGLKHDEKEVVDETEFEGPNQQHGPDVKESAEDGRRKKNNSNRTETNARRMIDVTRDKPIKVTVRVLVPVRDHPKFNFVGKLLGPKGNSLKRLQESTMTKMAILGRGSMKNKFKEEELRRNGDPKFSHLHEDLHVEITAFAPAAEAHARIAWALTDVRRFLVPDYNDDIRQEQMWEMQELKKFPEGTMDGIDVEPAVGPTDARASSSLNCDSETCSLSGGSNCSNECRSSEIPRSVPDPRDRQACRQLVASFGNGKTPSFPIVFSTSSLESLVRRKRPMIHSKHSSSPIKRSVLSMLTKMETVSAKQASRSHFTPF